MISTQVTRLPRSAKQVPVTSPTYPVPITQIVAKLLFLHCHKWVFIFFCRDGGRCAMPREHHQVFVEGVQLFANRGGELVVVAALEIGAPDAALKKRISTKHAIGGANEADATARVSGGMQHFERQRAKGDAVSFVQEYVWFALHQGRFAPIHARGAFLAEHIHVFSMDSQRYRGNRAHFVDSADMVDMPVRIEDEFWNPF